MKLPRIRLLDRNKIGEVELQSTYYDVLLSEILADQDRNVALRWANKSDVATDICPDAIISTLAQHDFAQSIGFGEVKVGNESTTKHSVCLDVVQLGAACKQAIGQANLAGCIAFLIDSFCPSFFMVRKEQHQFYIMTEIASLVMAPSLTDLHTFVTLKSLNMFAKVSQSFWYHCHSVELPVVSDAAASVVPISQVCSKIDKPTSKSRGKASRY
ncbi:hypothetical protein CU097_008329 [Rhizopus azygosporus]|uniref:Uncharacterized protein n=1 Tax=Rhizopus azygosporus TaxID=86630 RepID=A0A367JZA6_RHIAZ|nr:hypothetical protein CU097_008329 [Rhizopus azygosporus]